MLEYDISRHNPRTEPERHQDYIVVRFKVHDDFNKNRLDNNIAVLMLEKPIQLQNHDGANAACLPACDNMFDYKFSNGTGTRLVKLLNNATNHTNSNE